MLLVSLTRYNFAWDVDRDPGELSDITVSSVHTSDLSSFEDLSLNSEEDATEPSEDNVTSKGEINLIKGKSFYFLCVCVFYVMLQSVLCVHTKKALAHLSFMVKARFQQKVTRSAVEMGTWRPPPRAGNPNSKPHYCLIC